MAGRKVSYWEMLKHPQWQRKRLEILERDGWSCLSCDNAEKTLHVHHRIYRKNTKPWEYEDDIYETLCEDCHARATALQVALNDAIGKLSESQLLQLLGYAKGLDASANGPVDTKYDSAEEAEGIGNTMGLPEEIVQAFSIRNRDGAFFPREAFEPFCRLGRRWTRDMIRTFLYESHDGTEDDL